jgi:cell division protein FtsB
LASYRRSARRAPVRLHPGRLAVLVLGIIAAYFFVSPLRAYFAQQDRYENELAALAQARAQNAELRAQLAMMGTKEYVARQAREDFQLVPSGVQAFVVKGLSEKPVDASSLEPATPEPRQRTVVERLADLWHTIVR